MITIKEIIQKDNGIQKRPYADHIYQWEISLSYRPEDDNELIEFCKTHLKSAKLDWREYQKLIRETNEFDKTMEIVCGGRYCLEQMDKYGMRFRYTATFDYID